jgi:hypothetical protein
MKGDNTSNMGSRYTESVDVTGYEDDVSYLDNLRVEFDLYSYQLWALICEFLKKNGFGAQNRNGQQFKSPRGVGDVPIITKKFRMRLPDKEYIKKSKNDKNKVERDHIHDVLTGRKNELEDYIYKRKKDKEPYPVCVIQNDSHKKNIQPIKIPQQNISEYVVTHMIVEFLKRNKFNSYIEGRIVFSEIILGPSYRSAPNKK